MRASQLASRSVNRASLSTLVFEILFTAVSSNELRALLGSETQRFT
jgi:hypothetical protein